MNEDFRNNIPNTELILSTEEASILAEELRKSLTAGKKPKDDINQIKKIIAGLGDSRGLLRRTFSESLGIIGKKALPELKNALLKSENVTVRRAAAKTLKLVGDPRALPYLFKALISDDDPVVQGSSVGAMVIFGEDAVGFLLEVLKNPASTSLQCGLASWGLAFIGAEGSELLKKGATSESPKVRASVIAALEDQLQKFNDLDARSIVKKGLCDSSEEVQIESIKLAHLLDNQLTPHQILDKLNHKNPEIRKQILFFIMKVKAKHQLNNLKKKLSEETEKNIIPIIKLAINKLK